MIPVFKTFINVILGNVVDAGADFPGEGQIFAFLSLYLSLYL